MPVGLLGILSLGLASISMAGVAPPLTPDNLLAGSEAWSAQRPKHVRIEADFVTCTQ